MNARAWVLLALAAGCAPSALRVSPPDAAPGYAPADGAAPDGDGGAPETQPAPRCFPRPSPSGADQPGDFCASPDQCQHAPDEIAVCESRDPMEYQQKLLRCHRFRRGTLGEACAVTLTENGGVEGVSPLAGGSVPDTGAYCDVHDGLVCDQVARLCQPLPAPGQSCATRPHCGSGAHCDQATCVPGKALGELCNGINDFIGQPECAPGGHCDPASSTCVPSVAAGESCEFDQQCVSGLCNAGVCDAEASSCPR